MGAGASFVGDVTGDVEVAVHGRVEGTIRVSRSARVAPGGLVEGDIHARRVIVSGSVRGEIWGQERAELTATAVVTGSVHSPKILIAEGAQMTGSVAMSAENEPTEE